MAAASVVVSHSYPLALGVGAAEPLTHLLGYDLGKAAVKVFFAVSGYLILQSFERSKPIDFWMARAFRIVPALAVASAVMAFVVGPIFTTDDGYFSRTATWFYPLLSLGFPPLPLTLPGVFDGLPHPGVNGPLWTLHYEVACYLALFVAGLAGILKPTRYSFFLVAYALFYIAERGSPYATLSLPFVVGMTLHRYKTRLSLAGTLLLVLFAGLASAAKIWPVEASAIALSYTFLWLGFVRTPALWPFNRLGDYSYGVYIYGWPIQQVIMSAYPGTSPASLMLSSLGLCVPIAVLSWHMVEGPAMNLKVRLMRGRDLPKDAAERGSRNEYSLSIGD
jgi:peptidoglycan/LPS O-acetylase OafA/YrhL